MSELHRFVLRAQAVSLYRQFVRAAREIPGSNRGAV
jgi:hypothetical protein